VENPARLLLAGLARDCRSDPVHSRRRVGHSIGCRRRDAGLRQLAGRRRATGGDGGRFRQRSAQDAATRPEAALVFPVLFPIPPELGRIGATFVYGHNTLERRTMRNLLTRLRLDATGAGTMRTRRRRVSTPHFRRGTPRRPMPHPPPPPPSGLARSAPRLPRLAGDCSRKGWPSAAPRRFATTSSHAIFSRRVYKSTSRLIFRLPIR
jgi:hypothetical protein